MCVSVKSKYFYTIKIMYYIDGFSLLVLVQKLLLLLLLQLEYRERHVPSFSCSMDRSDRGTIACLAGRLLWSPSGDSGYNWDLVCW
jgi:hypothetical protein